MVRKATRRPTPKTSRPSPKSGRGLDPKRLPYADETQTVNDMLDFFTERLPRFIEDEFERLDIARSESEMFRTLSSLPDSALRKAGLRREDLPQFILSAFHLVRMSKNHGKMAGRARRGSSRRPAKRAA